MIDLMPGFGAFTPTSGGGTPLLDTGIASAAAGWSLRRLRAAYVGSAIRIRRSSDSTEQDIGFSGNDLNATAISSFVGANDAFIVTWYDQVGSENVTQSDSAKQPRIVSAGTLDVLNARACMRFDGTNDFFINTAFTPLASVSQFTGSAVAAMRAAGSGDRLIGISNAANQQEWSGTDRVVLIGRPGTASATLVSTRNGADRASTTVANNQLFTVVSWYDATNHNISVDGAAAVTSTYSATSLDSSANLRIGEYSDEDGSVWRGSLSEVVLWASALSGGDRTTLQNNQKTYWGTP